MQKHISLVALVAAIALVGCNNNRETGNNTKDMKSGSKTDLRGADMSEEEETPDLKKARDFAEAPEEDLSDPNADLTPDPNADLTEVLPDLFEVQPDMAIDPNADLAVDPNADLAVVPDMVVLADMVNPNADMATTACTATPAAALRHGEFGATAWAGANLNATLTLATGFAISGTVTWPSAFENPGYYSSGSVEFINRATGERYFATVDGEDADPDMVLIYDIKVPAGNYDVNVSMTQEYGYNDNAGDPLGGGQITGFATKVVTVCGDKNDVNVDLAAMTDVIVSSASVASLGATYDGFNDLGFWGNLTLESADGNLVISSFADGFDDSNDEFTLVWQLYPVFAGNFHRTLWAFNQPDAAAYATTGYDQQIKLDDVTGATAEMVESVVPADIVHLTGTTSDPNARLPKQWSGFSNTSNANRFYISQNVTCSGNGTARVQPYGTGYHSSTVKTYDTPLQKGTACDVVGQFRIRVPLADNATPTVPSTATNLNSVLTIFSNPETITPTNNTVRNFTVPSFSVSGETTQTLTIKTAAGVAIPNALVVVESTGGLSGTGNGSFNATAGAITNASGQVTLRLLTGTYKVSVDLDF